MSINRRIVAISAVLGVLAAGGVVLLQSHAQARSQFNVNHMTPIQRRLMSGLLATAVAAPPSKGSAISSGPGVDEGLNVAPSRFVPTSGSGGGLPANYFPDVNGKCDGRRGDNIKVNQNCLNITDSALQGRAQANNEETISVDPFNSNYVVAGDNNYIGGDGTCGGYFSQDGGRTWADSRIPNVFTYGFDGNAREYWQGGGDTSVAWDTRGNAYESCQVFNRGLIASSNPDFSSGFVLFRSTGNHGASWNFPGRYSTVFFDPTGKMTTLEDKALMTIDDNVSSTFRDRIYVTWTEFAGDGSAYIWESHSSDYGEHFSPRVLVSKNSTLCPNTFGAGTPHGNCNENQDSDPFVGPDGALYVAFDNFNNSQSSATDNHWQVLLVKSEDGGQTFSAPRLVSNYYDLPDCDAYQGAGADTGRSCVPEKGSRTASVFRATNYPAGAVDPTNPNRVAVTFGSYINADSNESNGCVPQGFSIFLNPLYTGVKTPGACSNKILVSVSANGGATFTGTTTDPRSQVVVNQNAAQKHTDQWFQWAAMTSAGRLAVDYYDREFGANETTGGSDFSLSGSSDLVNFATTRVTSSSMPVPTQFEGPNGGQFWGDYVGLSVAGRAHPIWSDTRNMDLFLCGPTGPGSPPTLCGGIEPNGWEANDQESFTAGVTVP